MARIWEVFDLDEEVKEKIAELQRDRDSKAISDEEYSYQYEAVMQERRLRFYRIMGYL